jgi:hypothetical protein
LLTRSVRDLAAVWTLGDIAVYMKVQTFDAFTPHSDPHGEHDFGSFEFAAEACFWKIDLYEAGEVKPVRTTLPPITSNLLLGNATS